MAERVFCSRTSPDLESITETPLRADRRVWRPFQYVSGSYDILTKVVLSAGRTLLVSSLSCSVVEHYVAKFLLSLSVGVTGSFIFRRLPSNY